MQLGMHDENSFFEKRFGSDPRFKTSLGSSLWTIYARDSVGIGARIFISVVGRELKIGDLFVHDGTARSAQKLGRRFARWRKLLRVNERSWRGRRIAPAMIEFVAAEAQARGFAAIRGDVVARDDRGAVDLRRFYSQNGFEITPPSDAKSVFSIVREFH